VQHASEAAPPGGKGDAAPGFYPDPLGSMDRLREWDGSRWTDRVRKAQPADAEPASAYRRYRLVVPRLFPFADAYRVTDEGHGSLSFEVPGGRWFYRELRILDAAGIELTRLRRKGRWWWPMPGYVRIRDGLPEPIIPITADGARTLVVEEKRGRKCSFIRDGRLVGLLNKRGRSGRSYDLDVAQDVEAMPIVAYCIAIDRNRRHWFGMGG
jgi:hypothetical protein